MPCYVLGRTATATIGALAENYDINDQGRSSGENTASTRSPAGKRLAFLGTSLVVRYDPAENHFIPKLLIIWMNDIMRILNILLTSLAT